MALENYVGRVGGLAVALGIGAAVATGWNCPAWADTTDGSVKPPAADTQNSPQPDSTPKSTPADDNSAAADTTGTPSAPTGADADDAKDDPEVEVADPEAPEAPEAEQLHDPSGSGQAPEQHTSNKPARTLVALLSKAANLVPQLDPKCKGCPPANSDRPVPTGTLRPLPS